MTGKCKNTNPLKRDGTSQPGRILAELKPAFAKIFEWEHKDWCKFVYQFAFIVQFYKKESNTTPSGNWAVFYDQFSTDEGIEAFLSDIKNTDNARAHVALLMAFIHLLDLVKDHINELTGKHLDFYYRSVLRLKKKAFTPDQAHVVFEAIKNAGNVRVVEESVLKAGKDPDGKQMYYKTSDELIVNEIKIEQLKTIFHNPGSALAYPEGLFYASQTNTADGLEVALDEGVAWNPFASDGWPKASVGFSFASAILKLKEGDRSVFFKLKLKTAFDEVLTEYEKSFQVLFTGEKGWLGPFFPESLEYNKSQKYLLIQVNVPASEGAIVPLNTKVIQEPLRTDLPIARVIFNVNGESPDREKAASLMQILQGVELDSLEIGVDVRGMKENILENDFGPMEPSKPFMPFGPQPTRGNNLFVGNPEIFDKDWKNLSIDVTWKDLPLNDDGTLPDFRDHYYAYRKKFSRQNAKSKYDVQLDTDGNVPTVDDSELLITGNDSFLSDIYILNNKSWEKARSLKPLFTPFGADSLTGAFKSLFSIDNDSGNEACDFLPEAPSLDPVPEESSASSGGSVGFGYVYNYGYSSPIINESVTFNFLAGNAMYYDAGSLVVGGSTTPVKELETFGASAKRGFIKLTLQSSFYHKLYPVLYAMAMVETTNDKLILPNEPYTPFIEALSLGYQACTSETFILETAETQLQNFGQKNVQLFHEGPFGFAQQHNFLKNSLSFLNTASHRKIYIEPFYPYHGEFFIGLSNAVPQQTVSLLLQFASGSEDPLALFSKEEDIRFWILASNEWRLLESSHILENTTNDFLQPGLFKFVIPKEATSKNTILPEGLIWLRVTLPTGSEPDAICKLLNVYPQAVVAMFDNDENNLVHLETSLPAKTISKMIGRPAGIKSISQPYNSFDGKPEEKAGDFYKRVSERLRHKQRAVTIWDYETLVLQEFPEVHKVKCLNHTLVLSESDPVDIRELVPGCVTVVVIPNLDNKNAFDPLQPRVSRNTIEKVEDFIRPICSRQVTFEVINPLYEEVLLIFKVLFHVGYDPNFYKGQLNADLLTYLSPWMGGQKKEIHFGTYLYESMVIHFIDSLPYVDMITDFSMKHFYSESGVSKQEKKKKISPSNSAAILVSKPEHEITVLDKALICVDE